MAGMPQHYHDIFPRPHLSPHPPVMQMKMPSLIPQSATPSASTVERLGCKLNMCLRIINMKVLAPAEKDDKDSTQEPRKRPPPLRLVKSNGSTATSAKTPSQSQSHSQSSTPPADVHSPPSTQHPERGRRHARGRLDDELPLPPPPPELPTKSHDSDNIMGSNKSKLQQDGAEPSRHRHHFSLRRKPVKKSSTPTAADPPATQPDAPLAAPHEETKVQPPQEPPAPPPKLQKVKSDEALKSSSSSSKHARGPSNAVSEPITETERHHAPEPSEDTVRIHRQRSNTPPSEPDQNEPITPPLKPEEPVQLLPEPTPVPEESPSKWGLAKQSSNLNSDVDPKSNLHFRGKSSTGFDIFKVAIDPGICKTTLRLTIGRRHPMSSKPRHHSPRYFLRPSSRPQYQKKTNPQRPPSNRQLRQRTLLRHRRLLSPLTISSIPAFVPDAPQQPCSTASIPPATMPTAASTDQPSASSQLIA
ncbi:hypothetical protein HDK77DRAFT_115309 [Phyllosticta capitalensis]